MLLLSPKPLKGPKNEDNLKIKTTKKWRQHENDQRNKDDLKKEDSLKNEDDLK